MVANSLRGLVMLRPGAAVLQTRSSGSMASRIARQALLEPPEVDDLTHGCNLPQSRGSGEASFVIGAKSLSRPVPW